MSEELLELIQRVLIALALGFFIGMEREFAKRAPDKEDQFAGVRSYTLIALFGFLCAYLAQSYGPWAFIAGLGGLVALVVAAYVMSARPGGYGITTELSGILAFAIGAVVFRGEVLFAVIVAVAITALLSLKMRLHSFIATLTPKDIRAFIQFVIISAVILPFLPSDPMGPNGVWDLHEIWIMVILVTGISLAGYLLGKVLGPEKGTLVSGIIGGLVSSTAVTLSLAQRSRKQPRGPHIVSAAGIIGATAVLYPRVWLIIWVIDQDLAIRMVLPMAFITLVSFGMAYLIQRKGGDGAEEDIPTKNPLNFSASIQFAILYMAVLWLMDLASADHSAEGYYATSLVFGATNMDVITLSVARSTEDVGLLMASIAVLLATLSNTVMKFLIVVIFGHKAMIKWVGLGFGVVAVATVLCVWVMHWIVPAL
ncbi:MAG: DUF4010 domain-containing protein [Flavobacteriales bacterium]|jgi:uncharacterized membrane protein (DUF4010 family)|nr:DUF4010 domain-containing protein [Flavobacteriales bacterium]